MVEATGVKMMPAKTPLAYDFDWWENQRAKSAWHDKAEAAKQSGLPPPPPPPEPLQDRWDSRSRGAGGPIWLAGYIQLGPIWASVWITLQGEILLRRQYAWGIRQDELSPDPGISERHFKQFNTFKDFISYLKGQYKTFIGQEPAARFFDMLKKSWERGYTIQWHKPTKVAPKSASGELDDEDEFGSQYEQAKYRYSGLLWAINQLREVVAKEGVTISPEDIAIVLDASDVNNWVERSGIEIKRVPGLQYIQITPDEVYGSDSAGQRTHEIEWPTWLKRTLMNTARRVSARIVKQIGKPPKQPVDPRTPEQRLLDTIFNREPGQGPQLGQ